MIKHETIPVITALCDKCGALLTSSEYGINQWSDDASGMAAIKDALDAENWAYTEDGRILCNNCFPQEVTRKDPKWIHGQTFLEGEEDK